MSGIDFGAIREFYIEDVESLIEFIEMAGRSGDDFHACSIDTEADSMYSYETKLCLIQFSMRNALVIIDPLLIDHEALLEFTRFVDRFDVVWMHGGDYDLSLLSQSLDWIPQTLCDTQIAARLLGVPRFGLADLLLEEYQLKVSKQSQKADWSKRPLSQKMRDYAYNDVRYLLDMGERFLSRLSEYGRMAWFAESCESLKQSVQSREGKSEDDLWRISGSGRLSRRGMHFLKHIWHWRDEECRRLNRPAFKFLGNREILAMAEELEGKGTVTPPSYLRPPSVHRLREIISSIRDISPDQYPLKHRRSEEERLEIDEKKFEKLRKYRDQLGVSLGLEPTLIATRRALEKLAATNLPSEQKEGLLMQWQQSLMSQEL